MGVTIVTKMLLNAWSSVVLSVKWTRTNLDFVEICSCHGSNNSRSRISSAKLLSRHRRRQSRGWNSETWGRIVSFR